LCRLIYSFSFPSNRQFTAFLNWLHHLHTKLVCGAHLPLLASRTPLSVVELHEAEGSWVKYILLRR